MLSRIVKGTVVVAAAFALSACAQSYFAAKEATPTGSAFDKALYAEYIKLAEAERAEEDWVDANFFGEKALAAASGKSPEPQALAERDLVEPHKGELTKARARLMKALPNGMKSNASAAAKAQAGFDCWMQEAEENIQPDDIAACKKMFMDNIKLIEKPPVPPGPWTAYFDFNSAEITYEAQLEINKAATAASKSKAPMVVMGFTDRSGSESYNLELSKRRAKAVVDTMELLGVDTSRITVGAVGEAQPAVPTADGVREAKNRRVLIRLVN